jgi:hypothetical protein
METLLDMYRRGDRAGIWKRYCGFLDLSMEEYLAGHERMLEEQLLTWRNSSLVKGLFDGKIPATFQEFRERARLTTYEDYADDLLKQRDEGLPEKARDWVHTSGRSGEYPFKWIPYSAGMEEVLSDYSAGTFILSACTRHGEIALREGDRLMYTVAPQPYISGLVLRLLHEQFNFRIWPPYEEAVKMEFNERMKEAVKLAYAEGIDYFYGITSLMVNLSEQFENMGKTERTPESRRMLRQPKILFRLVKALARAKLAGRPMRPSDVWKVKGIICGGMDTSIYRERIEKMWGGVPREAYACTEFGVVAIQHYVGRGMVLCVNSGFFEFLEMEDYARWKEDRSYRPPLKLLSEVRTGREYVVVGTNLKGGVLVRYVIGDGVTFLSLSEESIGLKLPQLMVSGRVDDVIDIGGFTRLTEKTIWSAVEAAGLGYVDWVVAKEYKNEKPVLHLYIEPKTEGLSAQQAQAQVHEKLKTLSPEYKDLEDMAGVRPLVVTLLTKGAFGRYIRERQAAGVDIAHLKPAHMNPKPDVISRLTAMSALKI